MNFFIDKNQIKEDKIYISGTDFNHIKNVLRYKENEKLNIVCKSNHMSYVALISKFQEKEIECNIIEKSEIKEKPLKITIFQGLPKSDKMELIIQKCSEIGVSNIVPVAMKRSVVKLDGKDKLKKITRWQSIAEAAAKQCQREDIIEISEIINLEDICKKVQDYDIVFVAYEKENKISLRQEIEELKKLRKDKLSIAFIVGPEGGFDEDEIDKLIQNKVKSISLGKRILRTETAPIVISSILMYEFGDIGGNNGTK